VRLRVDGRGEELWAGRRVLLLDGLLRVTPARARDPTPTALARTRARGYKRAPCRRRTPPSSWARRASSVARSSHSCSRTPASRRSLCSVDGPPGSSTTSCASTSSTSPAPRPGPRRRPATSCSARSARRSRRPARRRPSTRSTTHISCTPRRRPAATAPRRTCWCPAPAPRRTRGSSTRG
jgi:hypothetical protein